MLQVNNISKTYGSETILEDISFVVNSGERVALVGPNGSGKSTLLRILAGEERAEKGHISLGPGDTLGYLPQGLDLSEEQQVREIIRDGITGWEEARLETKRLAKEMATSEGEALESFLESYGEALERFQALGGYDVEHRIDAIVTGLGLSVENLNSTIQNLSGGQRTRVGLARILLAEPSVLLLDEPTNHLDIEALEWLEGFLQRYTGAVVIVSHDRIFLDRTVTRVLALDPETHTARAYTGTYSDYAEAAARELAKTWEAYREQEYEIKRMEQDIHRTKMHAQSVELTTTSRQPTVRRYAKKVAKKAKSREKKLNRYMGSDDRVDKPKKGWEMKLDFEESMRSGQIVLEIETLGHHYEDGPLLFENVGGTILYGERIALLGPNGTGKSTLLKIIVGELEPAHGQVRLGANVRVGYMPQEQESLDSSSTPVSIIQNAKPMSETDARNFLHYFLFAGDGALLPIENLSYGERARLILAKLVVEGSNFLVLDEPVNHLDIPSRERFEAALDAFPGTVLASVHDRAFIEAFSEKRWVISKNRLTTVV